MGHGTGQPDAPLAGILARCGLGSVGALQQAFVRPCGIPPSRERLAELQRLLAGLVRDLDVDLIVLRADAGGELIEPRWARPSMVAATPHTSPVDGSLGP